jgi:hypothetical protein
MSNKAHDSLPGQTLSWRDVLPIHPAAKKLPPYLRAELRKLGSDIKTNGLIVPIAIHQELNDRTNLHSGYKYSLLDGISRLDSMELVGVPFKLANGRNGWTLEIEGEFDRDVPQPVIDDGNPYLFVASANIHRRHLKSKDRQRLLIEIIAQAPAKSNRQIGDEFGVDHKTIASARTKGEDVGRIPHVETHLDTKGRKQPARKPPKQTEVQAAADRAEARSEQEKAKQAEQRKAEATDAEKAEANRRDTCLRISAGAFSNIVALANENFVRQLHERLADELFRAQLKQLMRLNVSGLSKDFVSDIQAGAEALIALVQKLSPPDIKHTPAPAEPLDPGPIPQCLRRAPA